MPGSSLKGANLTGKKKVILIKSNVIDRDVRLPKVIKALKGSGYEVTFLSWDRKYKASPSEPGGGTEDYYREIRLRLKAPLGSKSFLFLPIWWSFIFFWLMVTRWDIAQATNLDSIIPTAIAGKLKGRPVIYEILDTYEDIRVLPGAVRNALVKVDKLFIRLASAVILADETQIEELGGIPNARIVTIYDSPPDILSQMGVSHRENDAFTLYYGGWLYKKRRLNLDKVFIAVRDIDGVKVVIAGEGDYVNEIKEWARKMPDKIQYVGEISHKEALRRKAEADLLFQLRDSRVPVNRFICGCTLLEAMMVGRPILANRGTSTASKVSEEKCGLIVDAGNTEEIKEAIAKLKENRELCEKLGANSRKAYEQRYGWDIMEQRLVALYREMAKEDKRR